MDYEERTHLAILNEFVPEWRSAILHGGSARFAELWMLSTGQSRSSAFNWADRAKRIAGIEQLANAA